ncbi:hypothetical protein MPSEU_000404800 [Mayamaea pseudoterrestris]|nr:hypothetical protein MPSEU_000404800 [Mayamaea pseudoterrestris]
MSDANDSAHSLPGSPNAKKHAASSIDSNHLRHFLGAQQHAHGQPSELSPSIVALLLQQQQLQQQQQQQQISPQLIALMQRQQQEQLLALQLAQMQQQQQQQPQLDRLLAGLSAGGTNFDMLLAQQQMLQQMHTPSLLNNSYLSGMNNADSISNAQLSAASALTEMQDVKPQATKSVSSSSATSNEGGAVPNGPAATSSDGGDEELEEQADDGSVEDSQDTFPFKLYRMLMNAEKDGQEHIVSFNTSGKCFSIHKPRLFVSEVMPKYFSTSRTSSFQRQLNLYGFRRVAEGPDKGAYWHESFLRGRRSQCKNIRRKKPTIKLPPSAFGYLLSAANGAAAMNPHAFSVRQMIADGQLSAEQRILAATQQTNPALAAALLLEKQRQQADLLNQLVLRQHQERELERQLLDQALAKEQKHIE